MSESTTVGAVGNEQEFPATAQKRFIDRIPKPVLYGGGILLLLVIMVMTFPGRAKAKRTVETPEKYSSNIDTYEKQSPMETDRFSTEVIEDPQISNNPVENKTSFNSGSNGGGHGSPPVMNNPSTPRITTSPVENENGSSEPASVNRQKRYKVSQQILDRMDNTYQNMVQHFKHNKEGKIEPVEGKAYDELLNRDRIGQIEAPLKNLTANSERYMNTVNFTVPSGTRIRAVTQSEVNSDHPGFFTAKISSPMELAGYTLLCQSRGNARDRIPVTADKIIAPDGKSETQIPGEVQMRYAGLEGDVESHALKRLIPPIASAFVGAGAGYLYFKALGGDQMNSETGRINTADQVVSAPYQKGVNGVQNEIDRFGGDYPNTVIVPQGTQFEILVTDQFTIELR